MATKTKSLFESDGPGGEVRDVRLSEALSERYLSYALSTIMSRSLPDVRDGLKPVHRRLLFAMRQLCLDPGSGFKKSARVVGDVIGKFHPHGDQSIYDALVRLAQTFALRYPLVDGQGNFGNVDGDNAAAMRYTEARLTSVAARLLEAIDEDTVDLRPTYDGETIEPAVLPANFPNLLANGAQGIAVGMATSVPPHNVAELAEALIHLIKHPRLTFDKLVEMVPGPDFPTGGVLVEPREAVLEAYKTGRGSFRLRARWTADKIKGGGYFIVITEIPYQVQKARLIERIAELLQAKKLPFLEDVRDESAEDVRMILEPKSRNIEPEVLMESLFRLTDLEVRVPLNLNVLDADNTPRVMDLRAALQAFLDHRHVVLKRRATHRLTKITARMEVLEGYLIAFLNLDKVIKIIRNEDEPKPKLIKAFKLTDNQAEAILNMRLRSLRKLEEMEIKGEHKALGQELKDIKGLLKDEKRRWGVISDEMKALKAEYGPKTELGRRRTDISDAPEPIEIPLEATVEKEPVTLLCSAKGWIRTMKGHIEPDSEVKYKDGDREGYRLLAETTDKLLIFATNGRFYTLGVDRLPGGRGFGEPIRLMVDLPNGEDVVGLKIYSPGARLLVASHGGRGFMVDEDEVIAQTRNGKQVLNLAEGDEAAVVTPVHGNHIACVGDNRKLIIFPMDDVPVMTRGRGVILQKYKDGGLSDAKALTLKEGLTWSAGPGRTRTETKLRDWVGKRAQAGRLPPTGFPRSNKFGRE